jgi:hypothetical protein
MTLLLPLLFHAGCFKQDYSMCPPVSNVKLDFRLIGNNDFAGNVASVNSYIYDTMGNHLRTEHLDKNDLDNYQGMSIFLTPGDYRMVFWANVSDTSIAGYQDNETGYVRYSELCYNPQGTVTTDADKLWYGPCTTQRSEPKGIPQEYYQLTVPAEGEYSDEVLFTHAHRSIEIYVEGLPSLPTVEIEELPEMLEFQGMDVHTETVKVFQYTTALEKNGIDYAFANFDTLYFEDSAEADITVVIHDIDKGEICRMSLADAIAESGADPTALTISLLFKYISGNVTVTIPGWNSTNPGFEF